MAMDFVRVLFRDVSVNINLDGMIHTFSDIAEAAAVKHLGTTLLDARIPASALSLSAPVVAASKNSALTAFRGIEDVELSDAINCSHVTNGAWFLLNIRITRKRCRWLYLLPSL